MTATLKEAIEIARNGERERAQLLVAEFIQKNPDDPQAWYLLSRLVDSEPRRLAYLNKTLSLSPDHERAQLELAQLTNPVFGEQTAAVKPELTTEAPTQPYLRPEPEVPLPEPPDWLRPLSPEPILPATESSGSSSAVKADKPLQPVPPAQQSNPLPTTATPVQPPEKNRALMTLWILLALVTLAVLAIFVIFLLS